MKWYIKFLAVLFAVFCFVFACEVTQQDKPLTSSDEMFNLRDTVPAGGVMPQALKIVGGRDWINWFTGDSITAFGFALLSQDTNGLRERVVTDEAVLAWLLGILPDSLSLSGYTDTLTITAIGDSIAIQGSNSLQVPFRVYGVDTLSDIYTKTFPSGSRIINRANGAQYLIQDAAVSGYTTDSILVIPTGARYAALQSQEGKIYFSHVNQTGSDDTEVLRKMMQYAYIEANKKISTVVIDEDCYLTDTLMIPAGVSLIGTYQNTRTRTINNRYSTLYLHLNDASKTAITTEDHEYPSGTDQYTPGGHIGHLNIEALSAGHTIFRLIRPGWMQIHDIRIGSGPTQPTNFSTRYYDYAFRYDDPLKTKFYDMEVRNCKQWAFWSFDGGGTTYMDNVRLDGNTNGIKADTSNLTIINSIIENIDSVGIRAWGGHVVIENTHFENVPNSAKDVDAIQLGGGDGSLIMRSVRVASPFTPADAGLVCIATDDFDFLWVSDCEFHNYPTQLSTTVNQGVLFWENEYVTGITNQVRNLSGVTDPGLLNYQSGTITRLGRLYAGDNAFLWSNEGIIDTSNRLRQEDNAYGTLIQSASASGTNVLLRIQDNSETNIFRFNNEGKMFLGSGFAYMFPMNSSTPGSTPSISGTTFGFNNGSFPPVATTSGTLNVFQNNTATGGNVTSMKISGTNSPASSGTGTWTALHINPTVNQTGGHTGATRGVYVEATLTSAPDFRAFQNNLGSNVFNQEGGNTGIGVVPTSRNEKLQVAGDVYIDDVLVLKPTTAPGSPEFGMIYLSSADSSLYLHNGTTWVQLDN
jgi:hypothetical protein